MMGKKTYLFLAASLVFLGFAGCSTMEWRTTPRPPAIKELEGVRTLGVFSFTPVLRPYGRWLIKNTKYFYMPIQIPRVKYKVALLHTSPEAITSFAVNAENLAALCREVAAREIGNPGDFDYGVSKGWDKNRLMGRPLPDSPADAEGAGGYDSVVVITETFNRGAITAEEVVGLGEAYGVDAVLGLEPAVIGEIGKLSDLRSLEDYGKDVAIGSFVLLTKMDYEFTLFDARTGAKMAESPETRPQYSTVAYPDDNVTDLGTSDMDELSAFLSGSGYLELFDGIMTRALVPYLTLFRQIHVATLQKSVK